MVGKASPRGPPYSLLAAPWLRRLGWNGKDHIPGVSLSHCTCHTIDQYLPAEVWGFLGRKRGEARDVAALLQGGSAQEVKQWGPPCQSFSLHWS